MNVWRLKTHHEEPGQALSWVKLHKRIAIGWGLIGDIREEGYNSSDAIRDAIQECYPHLGNAGSGGPNLWDFYQTMQAGDLVILSGDKVREFVVEVQGDYEWCQETPISPDYNHQRVIKKRYLDPDKLWRAAGAKEALGYNSRWTLFRMIRSLSNDDLNAAGL